MNELLRELKQIKEEFAAQARAERAREELVAYEKELNATQRAVIYVETLIPSIMTTAKAHGLKGDCRFTYLLQDPSINIDMYRVGNILFSQLVEIGFNVHWDRSQGNRHALSIGW